MDKYAAEQCVDLIRSLWPYFGKEGSEAQQSETLATLDRAKIGRDQAEAIIKAKWRDKPGGYPPLDLIFKAIEEVDRAERYSRSGSVQDPQAPQTRPEWLRRALSDSFLLYGYAAVTRTPQHLEWARSARLHGLDLAAICAEALGIPYEKAKLELAEYGQDYRKYRAESEARWERLRPNRNRVLSGDIKLGDGAEKPLNIAGTAQSDGDTP